MERQKQSLWYFL